MKPPLRITDITKIFNRCVIAIWAVVLVALFLAFATYLLEGN